MQSHEKIKRACKPTHVTVQGFVANLTRQCFDRERSPAGNSGLSKDLINFIEEK